MTTVPVVSIEGFFEDVFDFELQKILNVYNFVWVSSLKENWYWPVRAI